MTHRPSCGCDGHRCTWEVCCYIFLYYALCVHCRAVPHYPQVNRLKVLLPKYKLKKIKV